MNFKAIIITIIIFNLTILHAQEFKALGLFGMGKPLKLTGNFNTTFLYNYSDFAIATPYTYIVSGDMKISYKSYAMGLDFTYSNAMLKVNYQPIPFNKISVHPHYKYATLHLGAVDMTFSPYSLNGFQFTGAALELKPKKFKLLVLGGKFLKGSGDYILNPNSTPTYSRIGEGIYAGYEFSKLKIAASIFHAKDDSVSAAHIPVEVNILPKENLITNLQADADVTPAFHVVAEFANSLITNNLTSPLPYTGYKGIASLISYNGTTTSKNAINLKANYKFSLVTLGIEYERVDASYLSLGSLYTTNGFENSSATINFSLFKNKLHFNIKEGLQNDLVDTVFSQKSGRLLNNVSITYKPIRKLSFTGNYSNTKSVTNFRNVDNLANANNLIPYYLDSLRLIQLNLNSSIDANYQIKSSRTENKTLTANFSYQKGDQKQGNYFVNAQGTLFENGTLNYIVAYPKKDVKWNISLLYTSVIQGADTNTTRGYGVNFNFSKKYFKKRLNLTIGSGFNASSKIGSLETNDVVNFKTNISYLYLKKHSFNVNAVFQTKSTTSINNPYMLNSTIAISLKYNYKF